VFRRCLFTLVVLACALALAAPASALGYHVRVEGKTQTIFGPAEPRFVSGAARVTALDALEAASLAGEFYYHLAVTSFGPYVDQVGRYAGAGTAGWAFKINGASPPVGADQVVLAEGDRLVWYWAQFGIAGGPETLHLAKTNARCYRVTARDDRGTERAATGATLRVDGRSYATQAGRACLAKHTGLVRAYRGGSIRSNATR
jgi:hypothetical protein